MAKVQIWQRRGQGWFQTIVKKSLENLVGNTTIEENTDEIFMVYPEHNAIVRVDVKCYKYNFSDKSVLVDDVENVFCYTLAKSIVDHTVKDKCAKILITGLEMFFYGQVSIIKIIP